MNNRVCSGAVELVCKKEIKLPFP